MEARRLFSTTSLQPEGWRIGWPRSTYLALQRCVPYAEYGAHLALALSHLSAMRQPAIHSRLCCRFSTAAVCPPNTGDKLRSGARVHAVNRRGHEAAPPAERRLRREGWCRRKLRQLHPLVGPPAALGRRSAGVDIMRSVGGRRSAPAGEDCERWRRFGRSRSALGCSEDHDRSRARRPRL